MVLRDLRRKGQTLRTTSRAVKKIGGSLAGAAFRGGLGRHRVKWFQVVPVRLEDLRNDKIYVKIYVNSLYIFVYGSSGHLRSCKWSRCKITLTVTHLVISHLGLTN